MRGADGVDEVSGDVDDVDIGTEELDPGIEVKTDVDRRWMGRYAWSESGLVCRLQ